MATSTHTITAYRWGSHNGVDWEEEWDIQFHYTPGGGDNWNEPAYGPTIEFGCVLGDVDDPPAFRDIARQMLNDWAEDWLRENEAEAIAAARNDREAEADDYADFERRARIDVRLTGDDR